MASSVEIDRALQLHEATSKQYIGRFAADTIPAIENYPFALVANTDKAGKEGTHWVAFYAENDQEVEMFDSFGGAPQEYAQFNYFIGTFDFVKFNGCQLQEHFSSTCGYYCMLYVLFRCKHFSVEDFVQLFTDDYRNNDQVVTSFINRHWKFNKSIYSTLDRYQAAKLFTPSFSC